MKENAPTAEEQVIASVINAQDKPLKRWFKTRSDSLGFAYQEEQPGKLIRDALRQKIIVTSSLELIR